MPGQRLLEGPVCFCIMWLQCHMLMLLCFVACVCVCVCACASCMRWPVGGVPGDMCVLLLCGLCTFVCVFDMPSDICACAVVLVRMYGCRAVTACMVCCWWVGASWRWSEVQAHRPSTPLTCCCWSTSQTATSPSGRVHASTYACLPRTGPDVSHSLASQKERKKEFQGHQQHRMPVRMEDHTASAALVRAKSGCSLC